ncbi:MAG: hypothetical protein A3J84_04565, partial [Ignavibacteria bacterium RIFOXYA2_FULL_37_17]
VKKSSEDSLESKVYTIVEGLKDYIPVMNDRNRLGFGLYKYMKGEGDKPEILVKTSKLNVKNISLDELAQKINSALSGLK